MTIKTFQGRTMAEALAAVKRQFGREAMILSTRTVSRGSLLGFRQGTYVEITAVPGIEKVPVALQRSGVIATSSGSRPDPAVGAGVPGQGRLVAAAKASSESMVSQVRGFGRPSSGSGPATAEFLRSEMGELKTLVGELVQVNRRQRMGAMGESLHDSYQRLVANAVAEELAQQMIEEVRRALPPESQSDPQEIRARLAAVVEKMVPTAGPIAFEKRRGPKIVALIGPTGVGKTTTVAKLAANFRLREQRQVGLITIDTYRIAAVEQLRTYARIIDVPLEVVMGPAQMSDALGRMADRDLVLIDTAGRSQRDRHKLGELRAYFEAVRPDEVHLVLSSTCSEAVLTEAVERFREFGANRVIFTKLDEAIGFGVMLGCLEKAQAKLSYVTTGQDVPDDIAVGQGRALAELIVGEK